MWMMLQAWAINQLRADARGEDLPALASSYTRHMPAEGDPGPFDDCRSGSVPWADPWRGDWQIKGLLR